MKNRTEQQEDETAWMHAWLHHIHAWDEPGCAHAEMAASISEMEQILTRELVKRFENETERGPMFYHDHNNGGVRVSVDKDLSIEPSRAGLLRVIGCGHFLLSFYKQAIDATLSLYGHRNDLEWATSYLRDASCEWEAQALSSDTPCDPSIGIGDYFNRFARGWLEINSIQNFPADKQMKALFTQWSGIKFLCKTMCFSNVNTDQLLSTTEYRRAYKEFLYLHICCIVEHDDRQLRDSILLHQYRMLNRTSEIFSLQLEPQTVEYLPHPEIVIEEPFLNPDYCQDLQIIASSNNDVPQRVTNMRIKSNEHTSEKSSSSSSRSETTGKGTVTRKNETHVTTEKTKEVNKTIEAWITETRESNFASLSGTSESTSATGNKVAESPASRRGSVASISSKAGEKSTTGNKVAESPASRRGSVASISSKTGEKSTTGNKVAESHTTKSLSSFTPVSGKLDSNSVTGQRASEASSVRRSSVTSMSGKTESRSTTENKMSASQTVRKNSVSSVTSKAESTSTTKNKVSVAQNSTTTESTSTTAKEKKSVSVTSKTGKFESTSTTDSNVSVSQIARRSSETSASGKTKPPRKGKKSVLSMRDLKLNKASLYSMGEMALKDEAERASKQNTKTSAVLLSGKKVTDTSVLLNSKTTKQWLEEFNKTATTQWNRSDNFDANTWTHTKDGREAKAVEQHWKLGCLGCPDDPDGAPPPKFKGAKGMKCCNKWVIVKTAVMVRVPARAQKKPNDEAPK